MHGANKVKFIFIELIQLRFDKHGGVSGSYIQSWQNVSDRHVDR
jgi:hypothetical protein